MDKATEILESIDPGLISNHELVNRLADIKLENPDFTDDDIRSIAEEGFKTKVAKSLSSKKTKKSNVKAKAQAKEEIQPLHQALTFDDL